MLRLIAIQEEDLEKLMLWRMLPEVTKYMYTDPKLTLDSQREWFQAVRRDSRRKHWIIEFDNAKIGTVYLTDIDLPNSRCSWGHYIADTSLRGRGIGKLLEYNIYNYVLDELGLNRLVTEVFAFNEKAIELHKKCGSQVEGVLRQHIRKGNEYFDVVSMGILRDEWLEQREKIHYDNIFIEDGVS